MDSLLPPQAAVRGYERAGFTLIEMMITIACLVIVLGLMISLSRHVRADSADQITRDILHRLDDAMAQYVQRSGGQLPPVPGFLEGERALPGEPALQGLALRNNEGVVRALKSAGLLGAMDDLPVAYYDEARVRDAWGSPIVFMPHAHPAIGMTPREWFFFSAGLDRQFLTRDDNLYSYDQP